MTSNPLAKWIATTFHTLLYIFILIPTVNIHAEILPVRQLTTARGLTDDHTTDILPLNDGRIAVATWGNINLYDGSRFAHARHTAHTELRVPFAKAQYRMGIDGQGRIWTKCFDRIWCLDVRNGRLIDNYNALLRRWMPKTMKGKLNPDIFISPDLRLWLYGRGMVCDTLHHERYVLPWGMGDVCFVDEDKATLRIFVDDGRCLNYSRKTGKLVSTDAILTTPAEAKEYWNTVVRRNADGSYYWLFSGHNSPIYRYNPKTRQKVLIHTASRLIRSFSISPEGNLWLAHRSGIDVIDTNGTLVKQISGFVSSEGGCQTSSDVANIMFDQHNGVWLAMTIGGVYYIHLCPYAMQSASALAQLNLPQSLEKAFHQRRTPHYSDLANHPYNDELRDSRGWTWRASTRGVLLNVPGQPERVFDDRDGLPTDFISALAEDGNGNIWASTSNGILCFHVNNTNDGKPDVEVAIYDKTDGALMGEYYPSNAIRYTDGRIVMAGINGWTAFHPDKVVRPAVALTPMVVGITVNNRALHAGTNEGDIILSEEPPYTRTLTLRHNQNDIAIDISAFFYAHPTHVTYRWRLICGRNTTWNVVNPYNSDMVTKDGILHLAMMKLPPDNYRLEVEASTDGVHFSGNRTKLNIRILPPWWATWWAYTLYVLAGLGIIALGVWLYVRDQRRTLEWKRQEETLQLRISHLLQTAERPLPNLAPAMEEAEEKNETGKQLDKPVAEEAADTDNDVNNSSMEKEEAVAHEEEKRLSQKELAFIQKAVDLIEQHLGDTYTVEQLASDLCMERTGLYKKLTALIDQSPQLFIRSIRLRRAAEMLSNSDKPISLIAYDCGFSSVAYMVRCFKQQYGKTPGDFRKEAELTKC